MESAREVLQRCFPELEAPVLEQLEGFERLFREWNQRINLVSRKDMEAFTLHHLVHSLVLAKWVHFPERARILDVGTGGGLPGLPLAICFPAARFYLCDSIAKKVRAVEDMRKALGQENAVVINKRAEKLESKWEFVLGRAVTSLPRFIGWIRENIRPGGTEAQPNGILYWKGSLYAEELESMGIEPHAVYSISEKVDDPYFEGKYIIHLSHEQVMRARLPEEA